MLNISAELEIVRDMLILKLSCKRLTNNVSQRWEHWRSFWGFKDYKAIGLSYCVCEVCSQSQSFSDSVAKIRKFSHLPDVADSFLERNTKGQRLPNLFRKLIHHHSTLPITKTSSQNQNSILSDPLPFHPCKHQQIMTSTSATNSVHATFDELKVQIATTNDLWIAKMFEVLSHDLKAMIDNNGRGELDEEEMSEDDDTLEKVLEDWIEALWEVIEKTEEKIVKLLDPEVESLWEFLCSLDYEGCVWIGC